MTAQQFASAFQCFVSAVSVKPESAESFMMLASELLPKGKPFDEIGFLMAFPFLRNLSRAQKSLSLLLERSGERSGFISQVDSLQQRHQEPINLP